MKYVDLNSDLGESFGAYTIGMDSAIIPQVTSVNVACGFHAGDPVVMNKTVAMAIKNGAAIGAHPGFPDLQGFGRRNMTVTPEEAYALLDADPETVKDAVKTAADVLMYMLAAQLGDNGGCYCTDWDGWTWHTNFSAREVMERRLTNCGASANLANYLLEGDYEEVGFILHAYYPGNGGGHVYNYFLYQGKYYIVDFSWYMFGGYSVSRDFPVLVLDRLEDYTGDTIGKLYGGVCLAIAHTSTGQHLPNIFGEQYGDNHYYVPEGSDYILLYESGDGYLLGEKPLDKRHYDYTVYWPGYQAA